MKKRLIATALLTLTMSAAGNYLEEATRWREERQKKLAADFGWLTVVGLDWLKEGDNRVGTDPSSEVPLPPGSAPERVAVISMHAGKVVLHPAPGVPLTINGKPATETTL